MKQMQSLAPYLMEDFQNQSPAMQRKICKWVSNILSEANLYNRSVNRYSYPNGALPIINHVNHYTLFLSGYCTYLGITNGYYKSFLENAVIDYFNQINYPTSSYDAVVNNLAMALTNYISNVQPVYSLYELYEIWIILQSFGTY